MVRSSMPTGSGTPPIDMRFPSLRGSGRRRSTPTSLNFARTLSVVSSTCLGDAFASTNASAQAPTLPHPLPNPGIPMLRRSPPPPSKALRCSLSALSLPCGSSRMLSAGPLVASRRRSNALRGISGGARKRSSAPCASTSRRFPSISMLRGVTPHPRGSTRPLSLALPHLSRKHSKASACTRTRA